MDDIIHDFEVDIGELAHVNISIYSHHLYMARQLTILKTDRCPDKVAHAAQHTYKIRIEYTQNDDLPRFRPTELR